MFDFVAIFTTGGVLLWNKAFYADWQGLHIDLVNIFIKSVLLDDGARGGKTRKQFIY